MIPSSLSKEEIERFSRQILLPEFGVKGQERLKGSSVLIIGAGGLGSPASLYLVAAGIGKVGLVDYDTVDVDNLHRQVIHVEDRLGISKVESAKKGLNQLNSGCNITTYNLLLDKNQAMEIAKDYDLILDASDNAVTRYMINDVAVILGKPLVSGAALKFDGQLTTYNFKGSCCYRCIYPIPPPAYAVVNCQFGGVLGPVTGTIGSLQALEAIRILAMDESNYAGKMLKFDGLTGSFRTLRLRGRSADCAVCGDNPTITAENLPDYEQFCGALANDKCQALNLRKKEERVSMEEFLKVRSEVAIIDVRPAGHFDIVRFPEAINIPIENCKSSIDQVRSIAAEKDIVCVCRAGNDSQLAAKMFEDSGIKNVRDIVGGMNAYAAIVDPSLPRY